MTKENVFQLDKVPKRTFFLKIILYFLVINSLDILACSRIGPDLKETLASMVWQLVIGVSWTAEMS